MADAGRGVGEKMCEYMLLVFFLVVLKGRRWVLWWHPSTTQLGLVCAEGSSMGAVVAP